MRGNVRNPACPGRQLFDLVTARWATLVLVDLMEGPQRWSELRRRAGGVSDKMLAGADALCNARAIAVLRTSQAGRLLSAPHLRRVRRLPLVARVWTRP